jgi:hypothetical protein
MCQLQIVVLAPFITNNATKIKTAKVTRMFGVFHVEAFPTVALLQVAALSRRSGKDQQWS